MNKFTIIFFHTYISKLKTKSFLITNVIILAIVFALTNITNIIAFFDPAGGRVSIAVIDDTGELLQPYQQQMATINEKIQLIEYEGSQETAIEKIGNGQYKGLILLNYDDENLPIAEYHANSIADSLLIGELQNGLQQVKTLIAASQINLSQAELNKLYAPVPFTKIALEQNAKTEEELNQARGLVYFLLFIIYFAVLLYANMIATDVATEKSSRVMEILISSVSPIQQMFAKIIGIGLLSLTQLTLILLVGYYSMKQNLQSLDSGFFESFGFNEIPATTFVYAVIFFVLGYFLYATLAAFLGSLVSRIEDVQQMITPMTMMVVVGFMIAVIGLGQPDNSFITVTSYIPFFTPMLMFMRVGMLNLPLWEPLLGIGILLITIILLAVFGAKVYKGGVLLYGKSGFLKNIQTALQFSKEN